MLVLTRKNGQLTIIEFGGATVELRVISNDGNRVKIGFNAPKYVKILREEAKNKTCPS